MPEHIKIIHIPLEDEYPEKMTLTKEEKQKIFDCLNKIIYEYAYHISGHLDQVVKIETECTKIEHILNGEEYEEN